MLKMYELTLTIEMSLITLLFDANEMTILLNKDQNVQSVNGRINFKMHGNPKSDEEESLKLKSQA